MNPIVVPVIRADGVTPSERYLKQLGDRTFLSLWSYPGVFRDQRSTKGSEGKEVADLLVVFENDIIIFSDKYCEYPRSGNDILDWSRWFRRSVKAAADQVWGAERWIKGHPDHLFIDRACTQRFPLDVPNLATARFHLVVVAHGASLICATELGGSGSLVLRNDINGFAAHTIPFTIGDLDRDRTFVHVLDDTSLNIVMRTIDTISDFTAYLSKKESFLRPNRAIFAAGEEELVASYLKKVNSEGQHDFVIPAKITGGLAFPEGGWEAFQQNPQRIAQINADRTSYAWDALIEKFNEHALRGDQYLRPLNGFKDSERIMRFFAREPRFRRRLFADSLGGMLESTAPERRMLRVIPPMRGGDPYFVLLLFPYRSDKSHEENRRVRQGFLQACLKVVKLTYPEAEDILGFATESGHSNGGRSEDAAYFDARIWTPENAAEARELQRVLDILTNPTSVRVQADDYPTTTNTGQLLTAIPRNPRNKSCPCGSGDKYKRCHGR